MKSVSHLHQQHWRHMPVSELRNRSGTVTIRMTVDAGSVTTLRRLAMRVCGEALEFIRIAVCDGGARMHVWLCVCLRGVPGLCDAIVGQLPGAVLLPSAHYPGAAR
jgi:hypothetical protein